MKEFEKWYIEERKRRSGAPMYSADYRTGWKAAMEQVLLWGSDDDTLFNKIKDEIYGE
ncbi:hypothetical protein LCGC14_0404330 [marine sediment metagenome]|uniref:Uncharacterized protein n=1 Tax=marine sediment metagenome TaxID=412755 RepID=A0A0F9T1K1_9ZZZZ